MYIYLINLCTSKFFVLVKLCLCSFQIQDVAASRCVPDLTSEAGRHTPNQVNVAHFFDSRYDTIRKDTIRKVTIPKDTIPKATIPKATIPNLAFWTQSRICFLKLILFIVSSKIKPKLT